MCYGLDMINWNRRKYTEQEFINAWSSSRSIAECLRKLGHADRGGNYRAAKETAQELNLTSEHMTGQGWNLGYMVPKPARPLEEILVENSKARSSHLRVRLIKEKIFEKKCYKCNNTEWMGQPVPLELEHINGNHRDNRIENLTLLCPNCHAQTDTYRGKNQKRAGVGQRRAGILKISDEEKSVAGSNPVTCTYCIICDEPCRNDVYWHKECNTCCDCGVKSSGLRCKSCAGKARESTKIEWPPVEELLDRLVNSNYTRLAKELGVSDNAIRKRIANHS